MLDLKNKSFVGDDFSQSDGKIVVGLDIGTTKVCAIVGQLDPDGKVYIQGIGRAQSNGVKKGRISNVMATTEAIKQAIAKASETTDVEIKDVVVGIAGSHIKMSILTQNQFRSDKHNPITKSEIQNLESPIRNMKTKDGEVILHVLPQEFTIDGEVILDSPVGMVGQTIVGKYLVVTGSELEVANNCLENAGVITEGFVIEPLASAQAVLTNEEMEEGVAMVDIGGGTTDIVIIKDNKVRYTEMIPLGGEIIKSDIKQGLAIPSNYAEELKVKFGTAIAYDEHRNVRISIPGINGREPKEIIRYDLGEVIQARVEEIFEYVARSIQRSGHANKIPCGIVLTGGGAQLQGIKVVAALKTGFDVRLGLPNLNLSETNSKINNPSLATGIGLVIYGLKNSLINQTPIAGDSKEKGKSIVGMLKGIFGGGDDVLERSVDF